MSPARVPDALPSLLLDFLESHLDARVVVLEEPSFRRILPGEAHPALARFEPARPPTAYATDSFVPGIETLRDARINGSAHRILPLSDGSTVHVSFVALIGSPFFVLVAHPSAGIGPLDPAPEQTRTATVRGTLDRRLSILESTEVDTVGTMFLQWFDANSVSDVLDCWLDAWTVGSATCEVQLRDSSDYHRLTIVDAGGQSAFAIVEVDAAGESATDFERRVQMREIADAVAQGFFRVSWRGELLFKNPKLDELFGHTFETFDDFGTMETTSGDTLVVAVPKLLESTEECVVDVRADVDGEPRVIRLRVQTNLDANGNREYVGSAEDVTDVVARESQLEQEALTDPMTGTANRRSLELSLDALLATDPHEHFALLLCDLDGFKQVNDSLGHGAGDEVISEVGRRLQEISRDGDLVARLGGDEFVIVARNISSYAEAMEFAERILPRLRQPFAVADTQIELSGSVGVALSESTATVHGMLQMADHAMYEAKRAGRNQAVAYLSPGDSFNISPLALRRDLRRAITASTLDLAFQPIYAIDQLDEAVSAEALLRWEHPVQGRIEPSTMISIAEQSGLIRDLGEWIITEAIRSAAEVNADIRSGATPISIAVNVSALQVGRPDFVDMVTASLDFHGLAPERLTIELTESFLVDHMEKARGAIGELTELGVRLAVDDFGTGYSTFQYLLSLPVSAVKIDPSFTARLTEPRGAAMLRGLSSACRELDMAVIAEGVETEEQLEAARAAGVTHAQGYLLGMPVSTARLHDRSEVAHPPAGSPDAPEVDRVA